MREGRVHDLRFHDLRHTFSTWLTQCGVDYAVVQTLKGEPLPGSAKYYIHNWESRLRDAVSRLETLTRSILGEKKSAKVSLTATQVPLGASSVPPVYPGLTVKYAKYGAEGQNRTVDTSLFRAVLCQLSYLGTKGIRSSSAGLFAYSHDLLMSAHLTKVAHLTSTSFACMYHCF